MNTMHLFAGGGGGLLADLILGHTPIVAVEWESYACKILRERRDEGWFPELHVYEGDIRMFDPSEYANRVDCIHAGFPCQDISFAGKQAGLEEGTRSGLYREVLRIAGVVRPRYIFLENVSAIISNGLGTVLGDLAAMGYDCRWCCIKASDVGAPHGRDRWWCLCTRRETELGNANYDGQLAPKITRSFAAGNDDCASGAQQTSELAGSSEQYAELAYPDSKRELQPERIKCDERGRASDGGAKVSNTISKRLQRKRQGRTKTWTTDRPGDGSDRGGVQIEPSVGFVVDGMAADVDTNQEFQGWWEVEPHIGRVTTKCANRTAQLKALGNGQVPLQAAVAWKFLVGENGDKNASRGTATASSRS